MKKILILLIIGATIIQTIAKFLLFPGVFLTRQQTDDEGVEEGEDYQEGGSLTDNQENLRKVLRLWVERNNSLFVV